MKRIFNFIVLFATPVVFMSAYSQSVTDKVVNEVSKARNAAYDVKNTTKQIKETVGSLLVKKDKKNKNKDTVNKTESPHSNTPLNTTFNGSMANQRTLITVTNIDYIKLKSFEENIKACAIVKSTTKKFDNGSSTIEVMHTGTTDDLLGLMLQTCKDIFTDKKIEQFEDGKITIKL